MIDYLIERMPLGLLKIVAKPIFALFPNSLLAMQIAEEPARRAGELGS